MTLTQSAADIAAWRAGRTQFRVPVKPQPTHSKASRVYDGHGEFCGWVFGELDSAGDLCPMMKIEIEHCPFPPGSLVAVREAWQAVTMWDEYGHWFRDVCGLEDLDADEISPDSDIAYKASDHDPSEIPWRSASTMPLWASRLTLEILSVRVERDGERWDWVYEATPHWRNIAAVEAERARNAKEHP